MKPFLFLLLVLAACSVAPGSERSVYYVFNEGAELPVISRGPDTKTVILFVHGGPGGSSLPASYDGAFHTLGKEYRTVFYDQRGSGAARGHISPESITIPQNVRDLDAVVASIKARRSDVDIVMVGHSFGGLVAGAYASVHSAKLKGVAFISPALNVVQLQRDVAPNMIAHIDDVLSRPSLSSSQRQTFQDMRRWYVGNPLIDLNGFIKHNELVDPYYQLEGLKSSLGSLTLLGSDPLFELLPFPNSAVSVLKALAANGEDNRDLTTDLVYNLANVGVPAVLFTGWKDVIVPAASSQAAFASIPNPRTTFAYGTGPVGHSSHIEAPDLFVRDFKIFLNSL